MNWFIPFLLLYAAATLFFISLRKPAILAAAAIFFTPLLSGMPRGKFVPIFRPNEVVLMTIGLFYILRLFLVREENRGTPTNKFVDVGFLVLFIGTGLVPLVKTLEVSTTVSINDLLIYLSPVQYYLLYKIVIGTVKSKKDVQMVLYAFLISGLIVSLLAILEALRVKLVENLLWTYYPSAHLARSVSGIRIASILGNWAALATFCLIQILLYALLYIRHRGLIKSWLLWAAMGLSAVAFVPTVSFATAAGFLIIGAYFLFRKRLRKAVFAGMVLIGIGAFLFQPFILNRINFQFHGKSSLSYGLIPSTLVHRIWLWSTVYLPVIQQNFIWGYGPNTTMSVRQGITINTTEESQYFGLLYTSGVIGLTAHLAYVAILFAGLLKKYKNCGHPSNRMFAELAMILLVVLSIMGISNAYFSYSGVAEALWLFYALAVCTYTGEFAEEDRFEWNEGRRPILEGLHE